MSRPEYDAFRGEVNIAVHSWVNNSYMRDLPDCAPGFQLLASKVGPSYAYGHIVELGGEVNVFGMRVRHGDLILAEDLIVQREVVILEAVRTDEFDIDKLKKARFEQAEIH